MLQFDGGQVVGCLRRSQARLQGLPSLTARPGTEQLQALAGAVVRGARLAQPSCSVVKLLGGLQAAFDHAPGAVGEPFGVGQFGARVLHRIHGLRNFFRQRAGLHLRPLRFQRLDLGSRLGHPGLELGVGDTGDHLAGAHRITLFDAQFLQVAGNLRKHLHARLGQDIAGCGDGLGQGAASGNNRLYGVWLDNRRRLGGGGAIDCGRRRKIGIGENSGYGAERNNQGGSRPSAHIGGPTGRKGSRASPASAVGVSWPAF